MSDQEKVITQAQSDTERLEQVSNAINTLVTEQVRQLYPMFARFGPQWIKVYDQMVSEMRHAARQPIDLQRVHLLNEQMLSDREDLPLREEALTE